MALKLFADDIDFPEIDKKKISSWVKSVANSYEKSVGELTYIFCSDEKILEINRQYLQHDYYTDIITFDYSGEHFIAGDIFISLETVRSNSQLYNTVYDEELHRVIIHGVLHLCGLGDKSEEEEKSMRKAENIALELLKEIS